MRTDADHRLIYCRVCKQPLAPRDGEFVLKYWELPPKPKWMRWRTYNRLAERFEIYDDT